MGQPPFTILKELGRGGMGEVYEVSLPGDPRPHVAKLLSHIDELGLERFRREGELVARLDDHPGIVRIGSMGVLESGTPYLVFERVHGQPLSTHMARGQLPLAESLRIARELSEALAHAHARGVVHRDVKPENVILEGDERRVRLLDFGIALAADMARLTQSTFSVGTPNYMASEQVAGSRQAQGPWTDVHAVGLILYECLVGAPLFRGRDPMTLMAQVVCLAPAPVSDARGDATPELEAVVARCLEKQVEDRYPSCAELAADLSRLERGEPPEALGFAQARRRRERLRQGLVVALGSLVVGGCLTLAVRTWRGEPAGLDPAATVNLSPIRRSLERGAAGVAREQLAQLLVRHPEVASGAEVMALTSQLEALEARAADHAAARPDAARALDARYEASLPDDFVGLRVAADQGPASDPVLAARVARAWVEKAHRDMAVHGHTDAWFEAITQIDRPSSPARQHLEDYVRTTSEATRAAPGVDLTGLGAAAWVPRLALARGLEISGRGGTSPGRSQRLIEVLLAQSPEDPSLLAAASLTVKDVTETARGLALSRRAASALARSGADASPMTRHARDHVTTRLVQFLTRSRQEAQARELLGEEAARADCGPRVLMAYGAALQREGQTERLGEIRARLRALRPTLAEWCLSEAYAAQLDQAVAAFLERAGEGR